LAKVRTYQYRQDAQQEDMGSAVLMAKITFDTKLVFLQTSETD
jgi:hypothetical protein